MLVGGSLGATELVKGDFAAGAKEKPFEAGGFVVDSAGLLVGSEKREGDAGLFSSGLVNVILGKVDAEAASSFLRFASLILAIAFASMSCFSHFDRTACILLGLLVLSAKPGDDGVLMEEPGPKVELVSLRELVKPTFDAMEEEGRNSWVSSGRGPGRVLMLEILSRGPRVTPASHNSAFPEATGV